MVRSGIRPETLIMMAGFSAMLISPITGSSASSGSSAFASSTFSRSFCPASWASASTWNSTTSVAPF